MTLEVVRSEIARFVTAKNPEVLAIKGGWGTGKTFAWKKLIREQAELISLPTKRYSYVSLFGVNSLEDFKFLLFQQAVPNEIIAQEATIASFRDNAVEFSESLGRKWARWFKILPGLRNFGSELRSLAFLSLRDTLICIDDLERKGNGLDVKDVLGLISQLKEEKNCKVVLILNDEGLAGDDSEDLERYREKVIDVELSFDPTAQECAEIAFDSDEGIEGQIRNKVIHLGIRNIRIIFRIKRLVGLVSPQLRGKEPEVLTQAIHTLTLLTWCYLSDDEISPNYEYVKGSGSSLFSLRDKEPSNEERTWDAVLQDYEFGNVDEFDLALARVVETGYVVKDELAKPIESLNAQVLAAKGGHSFEEAWRLYHDSFDNNKDQVISLIFQRFKENTPYISPLNLNGTVSLLRELGRDDLADDCIDHYVGERKSDLALFNLDEYGFAGRVTDSKIIEEFNKACLQLTPSKSLRETVTGIADKNGWGKKDIEVMSGASEDEYYKLFKGEKGRHLHRFVDACLQFGRISGTNTKEQSIYKKAEAALRRIAKESDINRRRVASYGIDLNGS